MYDVGDRVTVIETGETGVVAHLFMASEFPFSVNLDNMDDYEDDCDGFLFSADELEPINGWTL